MTRRTMVWLATICTLLSAVDDGRCDELPLLLREDFEQGADHWRPTDSAVWRLTDAGAPRGKVFDQFQNKSDYMPPHRSPFHFALCQAEGTVVGDFDLRAKVRSTVKDYAHRDACVIFGHQDSAHFYYVHFGKRADDHANQIFIVDGAPRTKISEVSTEGTNWDDEWHSVRVRRVVAEGLVEVFFDDLERPVMRAHNRQFLWGRIGIGSFDDTTQWDDVELRGVRVEPR